MCTTGTVLRLSHYVSASRWTGKIHVEDLKKALDEDTAVVSSCMSIMKAVQSILSRRLRKSSRKQSHAYLHVDLTQAIGKVPLDLSNVDMASISAHKLEGLKGSGILLKKSYVPFLPLINGGEQEYGLRGGTANACANMVFAKTLRLALGKWGEIPCVHPASS
jgi:cysteine desulfurase